MKRSLFTLLLASLLLSGCAGVRVVDTQVQSFSTLRALPTQAAFRFDRLPSQMAQDPRTAELERMAQQALAQAGLRRDDDAAHYAVQIGVRLEREDRAEWPDAWRHWGLPGQRFTHLRGWSSPWMHTTPWYQRELSLIVRDLLNGQVVYETHAAQEGPWSDNALILPAMFTAALRDFPAATVGPRSLRMELSPP